MTATHRTSAPPPGNAAPSDAPHPTARGAPLLGATLVVLAAVLTATPAAAQFGPIETLARRVSDLGFYFSGGGIAGGSSALDNDAFGLTSFGVELLFEVAEIPSADARRRQAEAPAVTRHVLREMEVRRGEGGVDTIYHYDVVRSQPGPSPEDIEWTLEVGIGYGQVQGLELRDPSLDLNTTIRTLPSLTLYLSYEPWGTYLGMRTGFLRTHALQVVDDAGTIIDGDAEAFMMGGLAGYAFAFDPTYVFIEAGYTVRNFPSVQWSAPGALPPGVPRNLDASGWLVSAGIQFPIK